MYTPLTAGDHATAYAQVLSSESHRHSAKSDYENETRIRLATRWLIENSDLDGDGKGGWGLPFAWDAFGDGTINPIGHPFTIDTAIVALGLLDALDTRIWSEAERQEIVVLVKKVFERWCVECWTQTSDMRGYFWYSPSISDNYYLANVSSMFCGVLQRFIHDYGNELSTEERELFGNRANDGMMLIENSVVMFGGMPFWNYIDSKDFAAYTNDLVHQVYILYGIHIYQKYGGQIPMRWTTEDGLRSVHTFTNGGVTYNYPQDQHFGNVYTDLKMPASLWGLGMQIAYGSALGDGFLADSALETIKASYGNFPDVTVYPPSWLSDCKVLSKVCGACSIRPCGEGFPAEGREMIPGSEENLQRRPRYVPLIRNTGFRTAISFLLLILSAAIAREVVRPWPTRGRRFGFLPCLAGIGVSDGEVSPQISPEIFHLSRRIPPESRAHHGVGGMGVGKHRGRGRGPAGCPVDRICSVRRVGSPGFVSLSEGCPGGSALSG